MRHKIAHFNAKLADILADNLSTMWCFWIVLILVLLPLLWQQPETIYGWIQYMSSAVFQAVALPVLGFVSKRETKRQIGLLLSEKKLLQNICEWEKHYK